VPEDLKFVIDDATDGDPFKVGTTWWVARPGQGPGPGQGQGRAGRGTASRQGSGGPGGLLLQQRSLLLPSWPKPLPSRHLAQH
jgi:hypothetical protein